MNLLTGALSVTTLTAGGAITGAVGTAVTAIDVSKTGAGTKYVLTNTLGALTLTNDTTKVAQTITAVGMGGVVGDMQVLNFDALGVEFTATQDFAGAIDATAVATGNAAGADIQTAAGDGNATFRVGPETTDNVSVSFNDLRSSPLGGAGAELDTLVADNTAVSSTVLADALLGALDTAISSVSTQRAQLGAAQNQMESVIASVAVSGENLSASESRVRDVVRTQVVNATASSNSSDGDRKPSVCRGRSFSSAATASSCCCVTAARLVPFG